jgi:hypothetical protein
MDKEIRCDYCKEIVNSKTASGRLADRRIIVRGRKICGPCYTYHEIPQIGRR